MVPNSPLAALQRKLLQVLTAVYRPKACAHGFVRNRSILTNAKPHVRSTWILNIDLENFFGSINFGRVRGLFIARPYSLPAAVATVLAQICTHLNELPQGAPTSPIISNMIAARLDGALLAFAKRNRITYTRFADDLSFSSRHRSFPEAVAHRTSATHVVLSTELESILTANGFSTNSTKTRLRNRSERQEVTGLRVTRFVNVSRTFVRRIRAMLHAWERFGYDAAEREYREKYCNKHRAPFRGRPSFRHALSGHLAFISMVRGAADPLVTRLRERYRALNPSTKVPVERKLHDVTLDSLWVLECEEAMLQGTAFDVAGVGTLTCAHCLGPRTMAFRANSPEERRPIDIIASSDELDLAVIRISGVADDGLTLGTTGLPGIGDLVHVAGYPNYRIGDSGYFLAQRVAGRRPASGHPRILVDGPIAAGMSGGPVVVDDGSVIGVVVSGAETLSQANMTEKHGFVPLPVILPFLTRILEPAQNT